MQIFEVSWQVNQQNYLMGSSSQFSNPVVMQYKKFLVEYKAKTYLQQLHDAAKLLGVTIAGCVSITEVEE